MSDDSSHPVLYTLARVGYVVKGALYVMIGGLAALAAFGGGGQTAGSRGALKTVSEAPFGNVLLWAAGVGLAAYALWRLAQATLDPDDKGGGASGAVKRFGYFVSFALHASLAFWVLRTRLGGGSGASGGSASGSGGASDWTATLMGQPFGRWLVGLAGAGVVGYGLYQLYKAVTVDFSSKFRDEEMSETEKRVTRRVGQAGLGARGVVFGVVGGFLIRAALAGSAERAKGLGGALDTLAEQPFGPVLLGAVAVGLAAFGVFCWVNARYREFG